MVVPSGDGPVTGAAPADAVLPTAGAGSAVDTAVVVGTAAAVGAAGTGLAEGVAEAPADAPALAEPDAATGGRAGSPETSSTLPAETVASPVMFTDDATGLDAAMSLSDSAPKLTTLMASGAVPPAR
jgi:hypothetical protein